MQPSNTTELSAALCQPVPLGAVDRKPTRPKLLSPHANKILVIEDDHIYCRGLNVRLTANNYETYFAHNAESALGSALIDMPDLIILDLGLPGRDGHSVMRRLKAVPRLADVPVIVLTGLAGSTHEWQCLDEGAKRFFQKPVDDQQLLSAVQELLG